MPTMKSAIEIFNMMLTYDVECLFLSKKHNWSDDNVSIARYHHQPHYPKCRLNRWIYYHFSVSWKNTLDAWNTKAVIFIGAIITVWFSKASKHQRYFYRQLCIWNVSGKTIHQILEDIQICWCIAKVGLQSHQSIDHP